MITEGVLSTYKLYDNWTKHSIKLLGYGSINKIECTNDMYIEGALVSLKRGFTTTHLFIANNPVIDTQSVTEDMYLLHDGVFNDTRAYGRCWFVSRATYQGNLISTNHNGIFTKCECFRGLVV